MDKVERIECGWAGHFCLSYKCRFKRNTHLNYKGTWVVISTVGAMDRMDNQDGVEDIGMDRVYETMAFYSDPEDTVYHDADVSREIYLNGKWAISRAEYDTHDDIDNIANEMHEANVKEITKRLLKGELNGRD